MRLFFFAGDSDSKTKGEETGLRIPANHKINPVLVSNKMTVFTTGITVLQKIVIAIGAGLCVWGGINLMEGYGGDNPGSKSQGIKQLLAGGGVIIIGTTLVPLLSGLLN